MSLVWGRPAQERRVGDQLLLTPTSIKRWDCHRCDHTLSARSQGALERVVACHLVYHYWIEEHEEAAK